MPRINVTRTYLELARPESLRPARLEDPSLRLERATDCTPSLYRYLYTEVGRRYHWIDRLRWSDAQLAAHLARPEIAVWVLYRGGARAGWFELVRDIDGATEIAYFGLLPEFMGRGLGKHLLTCAVETAWEGGAGRVWLHTCTLDDPAALPNYLKRGFRRFREEQYELTIDDEQPEASPTEGSSGYGG